MRITAFLLAVFVAALADATIPQKLENISIKHLVGYVLALYEERQIAFLLRKLTDTTGLPPVVFHSLRHCSALLKLQIGGGTGIVSTGNT